MLDRLIPVLRPAVMDVKAAAAQSGVGFWHHTLDFKSVYLRPVPGRETYLAPLFRPILEEPGLQVGDQAWATIRVGKLQYNLLAF